MSDACNNIDDDENIDDADDQEAGVSKNIHKSAIIHKLKFNDYVFDERQNLNEDLLRIELKKIINKDQ